MRLSEAIALFSRWRSRKGKAETARGYVGDLRIFCLWLRDREVERIEVADVLRFFEDMEALGWDPNTLARKSIALRGLFGFLRMMGHRTIDPDLVPIPDQLRKTPRVASEEDIGKLVAAIPRDGKDPRHVRNLAMVLMYRDSGARISELASLDVGDLSPGSMKAAIRTEKSRGRRPFREVMWGDEAEAALAAWLSRRERLAKTSPFKDAGAIFLSIGGSKHGMRITKSGIGEMLRKYSMKAGIPTVNAHSMRHKLMHDIVKAGGSAADVMNIAGHSSLASSTVYTMMFGSELEDRYRALLGKG